MKNHLMFILALIGGLAMFFAAPIDFKYEYSTGLNAAIGVCVGFVGGLLLQKK